MSLIVEDGTIVTNAESYISVAAADTYHTSRGAASWLLLTVTDKENALRRATDFMVGRYRLRWKGARTTFRQALDWPRQGVVTDDFAGSASPGYYGFFLPYDQIPKEVTRACAELALRAASGPLLEDQEQKVIQETVGPITTKYDPNAPALVKYTQVDEMLSVYLGRGGSSAMAKLARC